MVELAWLITRTCLLVAPFAFLNWQDNLLTHAFDCLCLLAGILVFLPQPSNPRKTDFTGLRPWLVLALLLLVQLIHLPPGWLQTIAPLSWQAYMKTIWMVTPGAWMPISLNSEQTVRSLFHVLALGSLLLTMEHFLLSHRSLQLLQTLKIAVCLWSIFTLAASMNRLIPGGIDILNEIDGLAYAGKLVQAWTIAMLPLPIAIYAALRPRVARQKLSASVLNYLHAPRDYPHVNAVNSIVIILLAATMSFVPGYLLVAVGGWLFYRYCGDIGMSVWKIVPLAMSLTCFAVFLVWNNGLMKPLVGTTVFNDEANCSSLLRALYTWLGFGLGASADIVTAESGSAGALNCPGAQELLIGLGGGFTFLSSLAFVGLLWMSREKVAGHKERLSKKLSLGGITTCTLFLLFGLVRSEMPWEAMLTGITIGLAFATWKSRQLALADKKGLASQAWQRWCAAVLFSVTLLAGAILLSSTYLAEWKIKESQSALNNMEQGTEVETLYLSMQYAGRWTPFSFAPPLALGYVRFEQKLDKEALEHFLTALRRRPLYPETVVATAALYELLGNYEISRQLLFSKSSAALEPDRATERLLIRLLAETDSPATEKILSLIFNRDPEHAGRYIGLMLISGRGLEKILGSIPDNPISIVAFGDIALSKEERSLAEKAYLRAVSMQNHNKVDPFLRVAGYYIETEQFDKAMGVARRGVDLFPESAAARRLLASLHDQRGNDIKANTEYIRADLFDVK